MKRITTAQYKDGINSLSIFTEMLREALIQAMPGVELRKESAHAWRGYQIEKYPGLKKSQYYCQIYLDKPNIVAFHEYYEMQPHPLQMDFDLLSHGFFAMEYEEQKQMLLEFIRTAHQEAIAWNGSEKRRQIVPERFI